MKKGTMILSVVTLTILPCLVWCMICQMSLIEALRGKSVGKCQPPPESFQESDLVGTWVAKYDTLILKEDGTYKQIYDNPQTGDHYESDWQEWWVEYRESGIPYLHLKGMKPDGIGESPDSSWRDFCEDRTVEVHGEMILLVIGAPANRVEPSPRSIELWYLKPDADTFSRPFFLQE